MKKAYDVIIIGGGIIGCATAFELAKRGITDILLIEKRFLTSGATGRCGAGIRQQWGSELNARIALESTHIFEHLEEYTGIPTVCLALPSAKRMVTQIRSSVHRPMHRVPNGWVLNF